MNKQYDINYLKVSMEKENYILLSTKYSSIKKMEYICNNGHMVWYKAIIKNRYSGANHG